MQTLPFIHPELLISIICRIDRSQNILVKNITRKLAGESVEASHVESSLDRCLGQLGPVGRGRPQAVSGGHPLGQLLHAAVYEVARVNMVRAVVLQKMQLSRGIDTRDGAPLCVPRDPSGLVPRMVHQDIRQLAGNLEALGGGGGVGGEGCHAEGEEGAPRSDLIQAEVDALLYDSRTAGPFRTSSDLAEAAFGFIIEGLQKVKEELGAPTLGEPVRHGGVAQGRSPCSNSLLRPPQLLHVVQRGCQDRLPDVPHAAIFTRFLAITTITGCAVTGIDVFAAGLAGSTVTGLFLMRFW